MNKCYTIVADSDIMSKEWYTHMASSLKPVKQKIQEDYMKKTIK